MSTPISESAPERERERPPDWSPVPESVAPGGPMRRSPVRRAAPAGLLAIVLWLLGHQILALVVVGAVSLVAVASELFPVSVAPRIERVERAMERGAGRVLSVVLMGAVQLLVFAPLWLLLRLIRRDPLALGQSRSDPTFWRPHPTRSGRPLYRRPFAYERVAAPATRGLRLRAALGLVVIAILVDVGVGAAVNALQDDQQQPTTILTVTGAPAGSHPSWRRLLPEVTSALQAESYHPFLSWRVTDFVGKYVNVEAGVRRSYQPAGSDAADAITVSFFGGSAMFGVVQRDGHTIASEFARLAEAGGIRLRVLNYGQPAYVNWQEALLLASLVGSGSKPDLAIFYDGFNDLLVQFALRPGRRLSHLQSRAIQARLLAEENDPPAGTAVYRAWRDTSAVYGLGRAVGLLDEKTDETGLPPSPWKGDQADRPDRRGADAVSVHARGVDLASRLAQSHGFRAAFFWQPSVYSKRLATGEEELEGRLDTDPEAWRVATRAARSGLHPSVVDLGDALDGVEAPVMYDFVHTNEVGARVVAEAIYRELRPTLRRLARAKRR